MGWGRVEGEGQVGFRVTQNMTVDGFFLHLDWPVGSSQLRG